MANCKKRNSEDFPLLNNSLETRLTHGNPPAGALPPLTHKASGNSDRQTQGKHLQHFIHKNNYKILLMLLEGGVSSDILTSGK